MKLSHSFGLALGVLLALSGGCKDVVEPEHGATLGPAAPASPASTFPALSSAGRIYNEGAIPPYGYSDSDAYHGGLLVSRYVLYGDSTFNLQFLSPRYGFFKYSGRYSRADSLITFNWEGWSRAGPWGATGTLRGDSLEVKYNVIMHLTDFVDGVYVGAP